MLHRTRGSAGTNGTPSNGGAPTRARGSARRGGSGPELGLSVLLVAGLALACSGAAEKEGSAGLPPGSAPEASAAAEPPGPAQVGAEAPPVGAAAEVAGAEAVASGGLARAGAAGADSAVTATQSSDQLAGGDAGGGMPAAGDCALPATVSFKRDVQPFLIASCGGGSGCHVVDAASTMAGGGYNHAYDWATAGAHASACPGGPLRFEVLVAVSEAANPPTCSKSRKMPPPDATGANQREPLTACQIATLQAWLEEPKVVQSHRPDDSSPATPYPMPPFN